MKSEDIGADFFEGQLAKTQQLASFREQEGKTEAV